MSFDLSTIKFNVETKALEDAVTKVAGLTKAVGEMNQAVKEATKTKKEAAKVDSDQVLTAKEQTKLAQEAAKTAAAEAKIARDRLITLKAQRAETDLLNGSTEQLGQTSQDTGTKLGSVEKALAKQADAAKILRGQTVTVKDEILALGEGFTRSQASQLASFKLMGATSEQMKIAAGNARDFNLIMGVNAFDNSVAGLAKMDKELRELSLSAKLASQGLVLTQQQTREYARALESNRQVMISEGKTIEWLVSEDDKLFQAYQRKTGALNAARAEAEKNEAQAKRIAGEENKRSKDRESALGFITRETERVDTAMRNVAQGTTVTVSNQVLKMERAFRQAGVSVSEMTPRLEAYRQKLVALQKTSNDRQIDNISRALGPQITDIGVGLATGQSPLTILLQQGGQLRDQMALAGVAANDMGAAIRRAGAEMASSVWTTGKGVFTGIAGALLDMGKAASGGIGLVTSHYAMMITQAIAGKQAVDAINAATAAGVGPFARFAQAMSSAFMGGAFAAAIVGIVAALATLGVQLYQTYTAMKEFNVQMTFGGARLGLTTESAKALADSMNSVGISTASALNVFSTIASKTNIPREMLMSVTQAAIQLEEIGGASIEETVKRFDSFGKDPVEALRKVQIETGLVTEATMRQVQELYKAGDAYGAAKLASETYANIINSNTASIVDNLSFWEAPILKLKKAWNEATASLGNYDVSLRNATRNRNQQIVNDYEGGGLGSLFVTQGAYNNAKAGLSADNNKIYFDTYRDVYETKLKEFRSKNAATNKALDEATKEARENARKRKEKEMSLGDFTESYINRTLTSAAQSNGVSIESLKADKQRIALLKEEAKYQYQTLHSAETKKSTAKAQAEVNQQESYYKTILDQANDALTRRKAKVDNLTQSEASLLDLQNDPRWEKLSTTQKSIIEAKYQQAIVNEKLARQNEADKKFLLESTGLYVENQNSLDKQNDSLQFRISLLGKTTKEQQALRLEYERMLALDQASDEYLKRLKDINSKEFISPEAANQAREEALKQYQDKVNVINKETAQTAAENYFEEFKNIRDAVSDTIADALFNGGKKGTKSLREAIIAKLREPLTIQINAVANIITQGIGNIVGSSGGLVGNLIGASSSAGRGSNLLSLGGNILQIAQGGAGLGLSAGIGQSISGIGSMIGSTSMQSFGIGMSLPGSSVASAAGGALGAGSTVGSAMSAIGSALPWLGAAMAIISLIKSFDDSGTTHTGGISQYSKAGGTQTAPNAGEYGGTVFGTGFGGVQYSQEAVQMTTGIAKSIVGLLDQTAKSFGKAAGYEVATGFADDTSKDGAWGALRISLNGQKVVNWEDTRDSGWSPREMGNGADGMKHYFWNLSDSITEAMKAIGAPGNLNDSMDQLQVAFRKLNATSETFTEYLTIVTALAQEGTNVQGLNEEIVKFLDGTSKYIQEGEKGSTALIRLLGGLKLTNQMLEQIGQTAFESSMLGADFADQLASLFGGISNLQSSMSAYYTNYFSEEERRASMVSNLSIAFEDLGLAMPTTITQMRQMIDAQDLTTESGRETFAKLIGLSGGITTLYGTLDSATTKMKEFTSSILEYIANLSRTEGSTSTDFGYAQREFASQLGLAASGSEYSLSNITSYADQVIKTAKERARNTYEYDRILGSVKAELLGLTNGTTPGTVLSGSSNALDSSVAPIETVADNTQTTQELLQQILDKLSEMQSEDRAEGVPMVTNLSDIARVIKRVDNGDSLRIIDVTPA